MAGKNLGPSASEAGLQAVSLAPPMTKPERLHRWADNLELRSRLELIGDGALPRETRPYGSPSSIAFQDWAFRAEGLRSDQVEDALSFFDLSEDELRRIVGSSDDGAPRIPVAVAAGRVRALAEQAEGTARIAGRHAPERRRRRDRSSVGARHLLTAMDAAPAARTARAENGAAPAAPGRPRPREETEVRRASPAYAAFER